MRNPPLPIRDGLNPSRARVPIGPPLRAVEFLSFVLAAQRHRHPDDSVDDRFARGEVVLADASPIPPTALLDPGTDVWFYRLPAPEPTVPYEIDTVYEDEDLLVVNKPPFLATMPRGRHITETVVVRLRRTTGNEELSPAHRLDRLTSGLLLLTKRRQIRGAYQEMFAARQVTKTYEAVARFDGSITAGTVWRSRLGKTRGVLQGYAEPGEVNAVTEVVSVVALGDGLARYTLRPHTGRTHQLRLHMWHAGVPIVGDPLYPEVLPGDSEDFARPLRLTATALKFVDPVSGLPREFAL